MYLLQDNKIISINTNEDYNVLVTARKSIEELKNTSQNAVKDKIYQLMYITDYGKGSYCFKVIQSEWNDDSSLGLGHGVFHTKGQAIMNMFEDGYTVYINNEKLEL